MERVKGLMVFAQETTVRKTPITDEESVHVDFKNETKVLLHHLTALEDDL